MKVRKLVSLILIFLLVISSYSPVLAGNEKDFKGHWAEEEIQASIENEIMEGYPDGTFRPDGNITRAEFFTVINRMFNLTEKAKAIFPDVKSDAWYSDAVSIAVATGYIGGFEDGTMRPENSITRQEVAVILGRILELSDNEEKAAVFIDEIPQWSKGSVGAVVEEGLMEGFPTGNFEPTKAITRAESVVTLGRINIEITTYDKAGKYGPQSGTLTIDGNAEVTADGITLQNLIIKGNLTISSNVGEGDVVLNNVTVEGTTKIYGGGENSVHVNDTTLNKLSVNKQNNKIRIVATGSSVINDVTLNSGAKLEEVNLGGTGYKNIEVDAPESSVVNLLGGFDSVTVGAPNITINLPSGASIKTLTLNHQASVKGNGTVDEANINADGVALEVVPGKMNVKPGVQSPNRPAAGGSDSYYNPPTSPQPEEPGSPLTIKSIENIEETVALGEEVQLPVTVKATMSDDSVKDQEIVWDGKAYSGDVGIFEYEGAVEGYSRVVKFTLTVELTGYRESEDGTIAYVSNAAAAEHAEEVITIEEVVVQENLHLPAVYSLPVTVDTEGLVLDLQGGALERLTIIADNVTIKNGTINELIYGKDIKNLILEDVIDISASKHIIENTNTMSIQLAGNTDLSGDVYLKGESIELAGTGQITGIVRVETFKPVTISVKAATVIVEEENSIVNISDNIIIDYMIVRENAAVNVGSESSITNPEKRAGVDVTVNQNDSFSTAALSIQSASAGLTFEEALDTADLDRYIHVAGNFVEAAVPGDLDGQFPQTAIDNLDDAKKGAEGELQEIERSSDDLETKQAAIDSESAKLKTALSAFGESRIFLDTTSLRNKLRAIEQLLSRTTIGTTHGHVPKEEYNAFKEVVKQVKNAFLAGLTNSQITIEEQKLDQAHQEFKAAYIELPFFDPESYTIEGEISFVLTDPEEEFTDFSNFKVQIEDRYSETGWSIHTGRTDEAWTTMRVTKLNNPSVDWNAVDNVYYTVATNKHIYTGTFTVSKFLGTGEIELTPESGKTGNAHISIPSAGENVSIEQIIATRTDTDLEPHWIYSNSIAETTALPLGTYTFEVYGYDDNHEYLLKTEATIKEGENSVVFSDNDMDTISVSYENFTGWNLQTYQYSGSPSRIHHFHRYDEEERIVNPSLKLSKEYDELLLSYYANHSTRDGEQWRYKIRIPGEQITGDSQIATSPHFEFDIKRVKETTAVDTEVSLGEYLNMEIVNEYDHILEDLYFYQDRSYLRYGIEISITDAGGVVKTKELDYFRYLNLSINDIFPEAAGQLDIRFSMKDTPFLIPDETIQVTVTD